MTKLSDALRGAADRAPVGDVTVSSHAVSQRVARQRGLRGTANGLVGAGAVALLAFGIMAPGMGSAPDVSNAADGEGAAIDEGPRSGAESEGGTDAFYSEGAMMSGYGWCGLVGGSELAWGEPSVDLNANVVGDEFNGGDTVGVDLVVTAREDIALTAEAPTALVLWEGTVVAESMWDDTGGQLLTLASGEASESVIDLPLTNCWDGEPLPGGEYEVIVSQHFAGASPVPVEPIIIDPTPSSNPVRPSAAPSIVPGTGVDEGEGNLAAETYPASPEEEWFTAASEPFALVVAGDVPEDPFGEYIVEPLTPEDLPANYLTPTMALDLFNANIVSEPWTMEPGTQRWIMHENSNEPYSDLTWEESYFGCGWDGETPEFPSRSAELGWLDVDIDLPSTIDVDYGWIVNDNPVVSVSVTNVSEFAIPGFYEYMGAQLYLVKDGEVVAEAYPESASLAEYYGISATEGAISPLESMGLLDTGANIAGEYLWRDVTGCWTDNGGPLAVEAGTYSVVSAYSLYITDGSEYMYSGESLEGYESSFYDGDMGGDSWGGNWQYTDLQVWTALGTITVTD